MHNALHTRDDIDYESRKEWGRGPLWIKNRVDASTRWFKDLLKEKRLTNYSDQRTIIIEIDWNKTFSHIIIIIWENVLFQSPQNLSLLFFCVVSIFAIYLSFYLFHWFLESPGVRVFANGPGDLGSIPGRVIPMTLKMELDTTLLNTQHYKVRFKGKVEQSREWSSALPYTLV